MLSKRKDFDLQYVQHFTGQTTCVITKTRFRKRMRSKGRQVRGVPQCGDSNSFHTKLSGKGHLNMLPYTGSLRAGYMHRTSLARHRTCTEPILRSIE